MTLDRAQEKFPVGSTVYVWGEQHRVLAHRDTALGAELRLSRPTTGRKQWASWVQARRVIAHRRNRGLE